MRLTGISYRPPRGCGFHVLDEVHLPVPLYTPPHNFSLYKNKRGATTAVYQYQYLVFCTICTYMFERCGVGMICDLCCGEVGTLPNRMICARMCFLPCGIRMIRKSIANIMFAQGLYCYKDYLGLGNRSIFYPYRSVPTFTFGVVGRTTPLLVAITSTCSSSLLLTFTLR